MKNILEELERISKEPSHPVISIQNCNDNAWCVTIMNNYGVTTIGSVCYTDNNLEKTIRVAISLWYRAKSIKGIE